MTAEDKAWQFFDLISSGQREYWDNVWKEEKYRKSAAIPWAYPPAMMAQSDENTPSGPIPHLEIMIRRIEASYRGMGKPIPWETES